MIIAIHTSKIGIDIKNLIIDTDAEEKINEDVENDDGKIEDETEEQENKERRNIGTIPPFNRLSRKCFIIIYKLMKKNGIRCLLFQRRWLKTYLMMKFLILFLCISSFQLSANVYSQIAKVSLEVTLRKDLFVFWLPNRTSSPLPPQTKKESLS